MALLDLLGRRWALRILWELREERRTFRALQEACDGVSPTVLNDRVRELRSNALIDDGEAGGYGLTPLGRDLLERLAPIAAWSQRWAAALEKKR
ncbi:MAG TPA: helix-turn-helix domain-containing protein [Candidatus Limnocylindrales bacterium]|nr:helix-turn-helix domain-containing protein [Candidatus Limnocylindrales bacterium]